QYSISSSGLALPIWSVNVLLPMPGSPPKSTKDPETNPPPTTRSSSWILLYKRSSACNSISSSFLGAKDSSSPFTFPLCSFSEAVFRSTVTSLKVCLCPQFGQFPNHLVEVCPQSSHTY